MAAKLGRFYSNKKQANLLYEKTEAFWQNKTG
jgi:hypothetical protein